MDFIKSIQPAYRIQRLMDGLSIILRYGSKKKMANMINCCREYLIAKEKLKSYPFEANIDPTNICNLNCPFCRTGEGIFGREKGYIPMSVFKKVVDDIGGYLYLIALFSHGEPFLCENLIEMVSYASSKKIGTIVHTNLNIEMDKEYAANLIKSGLAFLSVSIDGVTQEVYQQYRRGGNLSLVLRNIDMLNEQKRILKAKTPVLIWQYLLFKHNQHEAKAAASLAKDKKMRFRLVLAKSPEDDRADNWAQRRKHREGKRCKFLWTTFGVEFDGSVVSCCQAYHKRDDFGTVYSRDCHSLWNNDNFSRARSFFKRAGMFDKKDKEILCYYCPEDYFWKGTKEGIK